jgi:transcriptional regulator with XRE-family HTH domain
MSVARILRRCRLSRGFTQRELARRSGVAQPTIARIERGQISPRTDTLAALFKACHYRLEAVPARGAPRAGTGVDRTAIRELLQLAPRERLRLAVEEAGNLERLLAARR